MTSPSSRSSNPLVIVISGPSGVGKDAVLNVMKSRNLPFFFVTTCTTRPKRPSEVEAKDYYFINQLDFQKLIDGNGLLEWARVYGNYYGVPKAPVREALAAGKDTILRVDIQGVANIKNIIPQAVFIMILPPSREELGNRLSKRHTETPADLALRLKTAESELAQLHMFDYAVVNPCDDIESAVQDILSIIKAEKCRVDPRQVSL